MAVDRYTILHRKDERGVIVESKVFGPDDEIPEGFEVGEYQPIYAVREDSQEPVAESKLTPWPTPVGKGTWVEQTEPEDDDESDDDESDDDESDDDESDDDESDDDESDDDESDDDGLPVPPQGGPGSGGPVWAAYAASKGVEVPDGATRDEIIAACKAANVPVD